MSDGSASEQLLRLFAEASELPTAERMAFVDRIRLENPGLARDLGDLLNVDEDANSFLESPLTLGSSEREIRDQSLAPGTRVAAFEIESVLAAGGMGCVYRARQEKPRRSVALKLLHSSIDSQGARHRFALEAEVLGALDHPGIARIYDAGSATIEG